MAHLPWSQVHSYSVLRAAADSSKGVFSNSPLVRATRHNTNTAVSNIILSYLRFLSVHRVVTIQKLLFQFSGRYVYYVSFLGIPVCGVCSVCGRDALPFRSPFIE